MFWGIGFGCVIQLLYVFYGFFWWSVFWCFVFDDVVGGLEFDGESVGDLVDQYVDVVVDCVMLIGQD